MRILRGILTLLICLFLTGGHYGMLQCVAWAGMLWSYSAESGLVQGAEDTFSGEKPCCLCEAIAEAKQGEPEAPEPLVNLGSDKLKNLQCPSVDRLKEPVAVDCPVVKYSPPACLLGLWQEAPTLPPPRVLG